MQDLKIILFWCLARYTVQHKFFSKQIQLWISPWILKNFSSTLEGIVEGIEESGKEMSMTDMQVYLYVCIYTYQYIHPYIYIYMQFFLARFYLRKLRCCSAHGSVKSHSQVTGLFISCWQAASSAAIGRLAACQQKIKSPVTCEWDFTEP
jgi:hypothetical protein